MIKEGERKGKQGIRRAKDAMRAKKSSIILYTGSNKMIPNALDSGMILQRGVHVGLPYEIGVHDLSCLPPSYPMIHVLGSQARILPKGAPEGRSTPKLVCSPWG